MDRDAVQEGSQQGGEKLSNVNLQSILSEKIFQIINQTGATWILFTAQERLDAQIVQKIWKIKILVVERFM